MISFLLCESQIINFLAPTPPHTELRGAGQENYWLLENAAVGARGRLPAEVSGVFVYLCLPFWSISGGFGRIQKCGLSFFSVLHADWQEKIFSCEASFSGVVTHRKDY